MSWLTRLRRYLRDAVRGRRMAREIDEELRFHIETLVDELVARGANPDEARRIAARRFGRMDLVTDEARYARGVGLIDDLRQDVRYGLRRLRRQPGFAAAIVLTFGLGIGVNTVMFSMVDATLLKPLPFLHADRLFDIREVVRKGTAEETYYSGMSRRRFEEWRTQKGIFDAIEAYNNPRPVTARDGSTVFAATVSPGLLPLLGISPVLGRGFAPREAADRSVAVISEALWKTAFGFDRQVVGRRLALKDASPTVIGVLPRWARFPMGTRVDVWFPLAQSTAGVHVVARLRPGLTRTTAQPEIDRAAAAIQKARPDRQPWAADLDTIDPRRSEDGSQPVVLVAFGAVIFVLLTACANVANLLMTRASGRQREIGVRRALGASRLRIARQLLVESAILALAGGAVALLLAGWLVRLVPVVLPERLVWFSVHDMQVDWRVLAFGVATTGLVGLLAGALPAVRGTRLARPLLLSTSAPVAARGTSTRARDTLIAIQVAFALVLLAGSGLMLTSFARMVASDPGYDVRDLLAVNVELPENAYGGRPAQGAFFDRLLGQVWAMPGVAAATFGYAPPVALGGRFVPEGREQDPNLDVGPLTILHAGPAYFRVLGIRILRGRDFSADDRVGSTPVAIIDEDAARRCWPGQDPLGKRFRYSQYVPWITVIGVARNVKTYSVGEGQDGLEIYVPDSQAEELRYTTLLVRGRPGAAGLLPAVRARVKALEPAAAIGASSTVESMYERMFVNPRFTALVISLLALLALLTAAVGVYAMLWYAVMQRTAEIGIRVALGATSGRVARLVLADVFRPIAAGTGLGLLAAWWLTRFIAGQLYRVGAHDPATTGLAVLFLVFVAAVAAWGPVRRATRIDPMVALRCE